MAATMALANAVGFVAESLKDAIGDRLLNDMGGDDAENQRGIARREGELCAMAKMKAMGSVAKSDSPKKALDS